VRGVANRDLTPELAFALGRAAAVVLGGGSRPLIAVGRDTRASGPMLQSALAAGICSAGGDIVRLGVVPTPTVAFAISYLGARAGAVITASSARGPVRGGAAWGGLPAAGRPSFIVPAASSSTLSDLGGEGSCSSSSW
jgi:phosphoglucosamine mutase